MNTLEQYIYENIPIVKANHLHIEILEDSSILVTGNHKDHYNHLNSIFGGSLSTAMTLSAWGYIKNLLEQNRIFNACVVIRKQEVIFKRPVTKDFRSVSILPDEDSRETFLKTLLKFNKARITIQAQIHHTGMPEVLSTFTGEFAAVIKPKS